jgi:hypothetical protein
MTLCERVGEVLEDAVETDGLLEKRATTAVLEYFEFGVRQRL